MGRGDRVGLARSLESRPRHRDRIGSARDTDRWPNKHPHRYAYDYSDEYPCAVDEYTDGYINPDEYTNRYVHSHANHDIDPDYHASGDQYPNRYGAHRASKPEGYFGPQTLDRGLADLERSCQQRWSSNHWLLHLSRHEQRWRRSNSVYNDRERPVIQRHRHHLRDEVLLRSTRHQ
jgi:hypothetical protein